MDNQIIPWEDIKTEYVTGNTSQRRLAAKYGVSKGDIGKHSVAENWVEERAQYRTNFMAKKKEDALERGLAALRRSGRIAELALDRAEELLGEPGNLNGTQLCAAVDALRGAVAIIHDVYGLPTVEQQHRQEIDLERLALERDKLARTEPDGSAEQIVIGSEVYGI